MSSKQDDANANPTPKEIMPGQAYMARSSGNKWPEPHHWLTGRQDSPYSQVQRESSTQPQSQPRESSSHRIFADSKDSTPPRSGSQSTSGNSGDERAVEEEWLNLHAGPTPTAANAELKSPHPVRRSRKAAEEDAWTASLEQSGGVDYYGSVSADSDSSRPSHSPASGHASVYHDAEEEPSQKQESGPSTKDPAKGGARRLNEASGSSARQNTPALVATQDDGTEDYVFLA